MNSYLDLVVLLEKTISDSFFSIMHPNMNNKIYRAKNEFLTIVCLCCNITLQRCVEANNYSLLSLISLSPVAIKYLLKESAARR